jgi:predicted DNA-binding transcriptional regulator YafY
MKIDRLISIIMLLLERRSVGAKNLAEMFEVSLRTIYRDMDTINAAGIPIVSASGVGGGFSIMDEYKVNKKIFTVSDITTLLMGLGSIPQNVTENEIVNTLAKIKSFVPAAQANEIAFRAGQITIDSSPWMTSENSMSILGTVREAVHNHHILSFQYSDRSGSRSTRRAEPYRLVLKAGFWYVQCFCLLRQDFRLFKLTRITELAMEDEQFELRDAPEAIGDFCELAEKPFTRVKLLVHESVLNRVMDICESRYIEHIGDGSYIVSFPFYPDDYGYGIIFGLGEKCQCLEPPEVRQEMERRVRLMLDSYSR